MLSALLVLPTLAATALGQACTTQRDPNHPVRGKQYVCGRQGSFTRAKNDRSFPSPTQDEAGCASECFSDQTCESFSFNDQTLQCQTYSANVRAQGFSRQGGTHEYFFYKKCYIKSGDCGVSNGGFENGLIDPWTFRTDDDTNYSNAMIISNADTENSSPDGADYIDIDSIGTSTSVLSQAVTLLPSQSYTLTFQYSLLGITNSDGSVGTLGTNGTHHNGTHTINGTTFNMHVTYNGAVIYRLPFSPATTDVDNWGTATAFFFSAPEETTDKGPQGFGFHVLANGSDNHLQVGLDAIDISVTAPESEDPTSGDPIVDDPTSEDPAAEDPASEGEDLNGSEGPGDGDLVSADAAMAKRTENPMTYSRIIRDRNTWRV